jgi:hypothetical protein
MLKRRLLEQSLLPANRRPVGRLLLPDTRERKQRSELPPRRRRRLSLHTRRGVHRDAGDGDGHIALTRRRISSWQWADPPERAPHVRRVRLGWPFTVMPLDHKSESAYVTCVTGSFACSLCPQSCRRFPRRLGAASPGPWSFPGDAYENKATSNLRGPVVCWSQIALRRSRKRAGDLGGPRPRTRVKKPIIGVRSPSIACMGGGSLSQTRRREPTWRSS